MDITTVQSTRATGPAQHVTAAYAQKLETALPDEGVAPLEECWSTVRAVINEAV